MSLASFRRFSHQPANRIEPYVSSSRGEGEGMGRNQRARYRSL